MFETRPTRASWSPDVLTAPYGQDLKNTATDADRDELARLIELQQSLPGAADAESDAENNDDEPAAKRAKPG